MLYGEINLYSTGKLYFSLLTVKNIIIIPVSP